MELTLYIPDEKEPLSPMLFLPGAPSKAMRISSSLAKFFSESLSIKVFCMDSKSPTLK